MSDIDTITRQFALRRAAGFLELGELLLDGDASIPPSARRVLERAIAELAALPGGFRDIPAVTLLEGMALRSLGRWQEALGPLSRTVTAEPQRVEAWLALGWCLKRLGRIGDAIAALQAGLAGCPDRPILFYNLACYQALVGNVAAAVELLARAIALDDRYRDMTGSERDFDPIRADPRFAAAVQAVA